MDLGNLILMILCSVGPAVALVGYIRYRDRENPEPFGKIVKGLFFGIISAFVSVLVISPILNYIPYLLNISEVYEIPFVRGIFTAFYHAAIPEETAKFIMLWLLLRKCKEFDENMDGIVYAVCVGMGFAGLENLMYVFQNEEAWGMTAFVRALFSVPGHYIFAVLMGLFYSLFHFHPQKYAKYKPLILIAPIIAHGIYDSICFFGMEDEVLNLLVYIPLIWFCIKMHKFCLQRIKSIELYDQDKKDLNTFTNAMRRNE